MGQQTAAAAHAPPDRRGLGLVLDIDGALRTTALRHPLRTARRRVSPASRDRRSVMGMAGVLRTLVRIDPQAPVTYLTGAPAILHGPLRRALQRDGYPPGPIEGPSTGGWRAARTHKTHVLEKLLRSGPNQRWVLLGDDGEHDPFVFSDITRRLPGRVAVIVLRQVGRPHAGVDPTDRVRRRVGDVPVLAGLTGEELLPRLVAQLDLATPETPPVVDWFLSAEERGNEATQVRAWTEGNSARALVHGRSYFPALARALTTAGRADEVLLAGWRADAEELLADDGPTGAAALSDAARRGASVRGLLWRSRARILGFAAHKNRAFATEVGAAGGQVLLDQRVRPLGSHHQKFAVVRRRSRPQDDVAFIGGLDVGFSRRDDARHRGDRQRRSFSPVYGAIPAWHDAQVELRGPAVWDTEEVFRERWHDPSPLTRLPWRTAADRLRGLPRVSPTMPPHLPDPPAQGTCAVQLLRTYPRRRPGYPFAPYGERSVARGYAKALNRAQRLIYVEDQYLWSADVARVFATALHRAPELHLIAVVPRFPDQESPIRLPSVRLGQAAALEMVREAGGERVQILSLEDTGGTPIYVHAKLCVVDDVWAAVGSANLNRRSWTHDSELAAAVVDDERDPREPVDPGGYGDGARRFARDLRLQLMTEHLGRAEGEHADLLDPAQAAATLRDSAAALDAWYDAGATGPRPPGRLRRHSLPSGPYWQSRLITPLYSTVFDPDGRPWGMRLRRTF